MALQGGGDLGVGGAVVDEAQLPVGVGLVAHGGDGLLEHGQGWVVDRGEHRDERAAPAAIVRGRRRGRRGSREAGAACGSISAGSTHTARVTSAGLQSLDAEVQRDRARRDLTVDPVPARPPAVSGGQRALPQLGGASARPSVAVTRARTVPCRSRQSWGSSIARAENVTSPASVSGNVTVALGRHHQDASEHPIGADRPSHRLGSLVQTRSQGRQRQPLPCATHVSLGLRCVIALELDRLLIAGGERNDTLRRQRYVHRRCRCVTSSWVRASACAEVTSWSASRVDGGQQRLAECLTSVLRHTIPGSPILVCDRVDAGSRVPELVRTTLEDGDLRPTTSGTYEQPAACDAGIQAAAPADVVILNGDCVVTGRVADRIACGRRQRLKGRDCDRALERRRDRLGASAQPSERRRCPPAWGWTTSPPRYVRGPPSIRISPAAVRTVCTSGAAALELVGQSASTRSGLLAALHHPRVAPRSRRRRLRPAAGGWCLRPRDAPAGDDAVAAALPVV